MLRQSVFRTAWATARRQRYGAAAVLFACAVLVLSVMLPGSSASAASIGVAPTLLDVKRGESVAGLRVRNGDAGKAVSVQVRVVRWRQDASGNVYEPAEGVVASPPVTRIAPGAENLIRIVRTAKEAVAGEESYRVLVDELPDPDAAQAGVVSILIRQSVPLFFSSPKATPAQPQWRISRIAAQTTPSPPTPLPQAGEGSVGKHDSPPPLPQMGEGGAAYSWRVTVTNTGDKRLRLADLVLRDANGTQVAVRPGLVGYVLGHASQEFVVQAVEGTPSATPDSAPATLRVVVQSETASIETALLPVVSP